MGHDSNRAAAPAVPRVLTDALAVWERPLLNRLDASDAEVAPVGSGPEYGIYS